MLSETSREPTQGDRKSYQPKRPMTTYHAATNFPSFTITASQPVLINACSRQFLWPLSTAFDHFTVGALYQQFGACDIGLP